MARGERPSKLGDSWFSAKTIEVVRRVMPVWGRALDGLGGSDPYQTYPSSEYPRVNPADVRRVLSSVAERETAQIAS